VKQMPKLHVFLLVLAWLLAMTWGQVGVLVVTAALACIELLLWRLDMAYPRWLRWSWRLPIRAERSGPVPSYDAIRHAIAMGAHSRREFDFNMRRRLERVASTRLDVEHGIDLHRDPETARRVLGDDVWELLDPARPISADRTGGGVAPDRLTRVVDRLERL
jgi:hypothetical protein